jgi:predicted membrane protein
MQKFILFILAIGLIFFLFLLQTGQISKNSFNINNYKKEAEFSIHKNTDIDSITNSSDIYLTINGQDYKIFTFSGNDFHDLVKFQYPLEEYRGNRRNHWNMDWK